MKKKEMMPQLTSDQICQHLRQLRQNSGFTQKELAELMHCERSTYTYIENGKTEPKLSELFLICRIYNLSLPAFLDVIVGADSSKKISVKCGLAIYDLDERERRIIGTYRLCEQAEKETIFSFVAKCWKKTKI